MSINRTAIKAAARERLRTAVPRPCYEGALFILVAGILTALSTALLASRITQSSMDTYMKYILAGQTENALRYLSSLVPPLSDQLFSQGLDLLRGIVSVGLTIFAMNTMRQREASLWNLLDGFGRFFPLLVLLVIRQFLISAWTYLLFVPGVLAFYRYRLALYLMLDHPELNAIQCILLSGRMMRGNKWQLFLLDLSFLGWALLAALPVSLLSPFGLVPLILGCLGTAAALAWLLPYYEMSCVGFYEAVKTPLVFESPEL